MKDLIEYIKAFFPWYTDDEARRFLALNTPFPIIKNPETIRHYIKTQVVNNWDLYVSELDFRGYDVGDEKPGGKFIHPVDMFLINTISTPKPIFMMNDNNDLDPRGSQRSGRDPKRDS